MKIVVAGGRTKADFLIATLLENNHKLVVINDDEAYCEYLAATHHIPVIYGDPCKKYVMDDADIYNYDVMIALKPDDADNLEICQMGNRLYHIKKTVCIVSNPKNVDVFRELGVSNAISATYAVAHIIAQASTIDNLIKTLDLEDEKITITELTIEGKNKICGKKIMNLSIPENVIISCIVRDKQMIVPNGSAIIKKGDKLLVLASEEKQAEAIRVITGGQK